MLSLRRGADSVDLDLNLGLEVRRKGGEEGRFTLRWVVRRCVGARG